MYTITYLDIERSYDLNIFYDGNTFLYYSIINSNISVEYNISYTYM